MKYDAFEIFEIIGLEKPLKDQDLSKGSMSLSRYYDLVRKYENLTIHDLVTICTDWFDHFETRVDEEANLLREDYFDLLSKLEHLTLEEEEDQDYQI